MGNDQIMREVVVAIDPVVQYGYPATASVQVLQNSLGQKHRIDYAGAPSTLFANAPNGSEFTDNTNSDTYVKAGAIGSGKDGAWVQT